MNYIEMSKICESCIEMSKICESCREVNNASCMDCDRCKNCKKLNKDKSGDGKDE